MTWSGTTMWSGSMSSRRLPTALTAKMNSTPSDLQRPDIGASGQLRREDAVADAMSRKERDALSIKGANDYRITGRPKWCVNGDLVDIGQAVHLVETAAADHSNTCAMFSHGRAPWW